MTARTVVGQDAREKLLTIATDPALTGFIVLATRGGRIHRLTEMPTDALEAMVLMSGLAKRYDDVVGTMPATLRAALKDITEVIDSIPEAKE